MLKSSFQKLIQKTKRTLLNIQARSKKQTWPNQSIVFYASETPYEWTPESLNTGIGGAEGRIIHLARAWAKLGYQVTVFNSCGSKAGVYEGVSYLSHSKFNPFDRFDTLIVWHFAWRIKFPIKANRVWLDLGKGVLLPQESTYQKLGNYDKIFCKNKFHRSTLPEIPDKKIAIIPNGLDDDFQKLRSNPKNPNKIIYASNYARGLERMLEFGWPLIRQELPFAELHIFYGWPQGISQEWKAKMDKLMQQPGVIERGKVSRTRLMQEKSTSVIHYYGCTFSEIDCNTVRESAFVGCVPVTTDYAGLRDKDYCVKVPGDPFAPETQAALANQIVSLLKDPEQLSMLSDKLFQLVRSETWDNVAAQWLSEM
jgi:glycosyltransferase involved in cell wall biosynthesis